MAPTPGEQSGDYGHSYQATPQVSSYAPTDNIPSVVSSTYTPDAYHTITVAYLINSYVGSNGQTSTYTISGFTKLAEAAALASELDSARSIQAEASLNSVIDSLYSTSSPAPTLAQGQNQNPYHSATPGYSPPVAAASPTPSQSLVSAPQGLEHHGPPTVKIAAGIMGSILFCLVVIVISFLCIGHYRRKARKAQAAALGGSTSSEMAGVGNGRPKLPAAAGTREERAHLASPSEVQIPPAAGALTVGATVVPPTSAQEPPVILSTTMNTYFTGIDTSDRVSLSDVRSMASHDTFGEEPPPPYRPRSVPPISRETSVRTSHTAVPGRNSSVRSRCETLSSGSMIRRSNEVRSPFDDPEEEDEDNLSDVSTIRGDESRMSTDHSSIDSSLHRNDGTLSHTGS